MDQNLQHSARVDIYLLVNGRRLDVASCLGNKCTLRNPDEAAPDHAELVITVDGEERRRRVYLPQGISLESNDVELEPSRTI